MWPIMKIWRPTLHNLLVNRKICESFNLYQEKTNNKQKHLTEIRTFNYVLRKNNNKPWSQDIKFENGDQTQISRIWLSPIQPICCLRFKTGLPTQFHNLWHRARIILLAKQIYWFQYHYCQMWVCGLGNYKAGKGIHWLAVWQGEVNTQIRLGMGVGSAC